MNVAALRLGLLGLCGAVTISVTAAVADAAAKRDIDRTKIGSNLQCLIDAARRADHAERARCAGNGRAVWDGQLVELQLHIRAGISPKALPDALFERLGGRSSVRGIDTMLAWLPLQRVATLRDAEPRIAFIQLPQRPVEWTGKVAGQGGVILRDEKLACVGATGKGVTVAVVDSGFKGLDKSIEDKEVPKVVGEVQYTGGTHGTMCAEVVSEVAPEARIRPFATPSFPILQAFVQELAGENKHSVDIVSHSVGWLGMSFGRHTGPLCKVTDMARAAGIAWVNASGNNGGGNFYQGVYRDDDFDGNHDVLPNEPKLMFKLGHNARVQLYFDWDDYEAHKIDLDLQLFREEKGFFKLFSNSSKAHNLFVGTSEVIAIKAVPAGTYAVVIRRAKGSVNPKGVRLRLLNKSTKSTSLSVHTKHNNVYDPASCKGVLAVGALRHNLYTKGPLEKYSSYGPLIDGRQKPEIVAPTGVKTSVGAFFGTSAACPHVAGALALYAQVTNTTALDMIEPLLEDAIAMGSENPDVAYGHGRLFASAQRLGWACDPKEVDLPAPCTTTCGTVGKRWCHANCGWNKCVPPWESCNGVDDDCDGLTDEEPECARDVHDAGSSEDTVADDTDSSADASVTTKPAPLPDDGGCGAAGPPRSGLARPLLLLMLWALSLMSLVAHRRRRC